jgi:hypothetical protein
VQENNQDIEKQTNDTELQQLRAEIDRRNRINTLASERLEFLEKEKLKEEKVSQTKIKEFESYLKPVYAAVKNKGDMMNRIFDGHHIDSSKKGFLEREMAIAAIHVIPKYENKPIIEMQSNISRWIESANEKRIATKAGSLIHPTETDEGYNKFRYHILNTEDDYKKQKENLSFRTESANKTEENRSEEFNTLEQLKKQQEVVQEPEGMIMNNEGQITGGE